MPNTSPLSFADLSEAKDGEYEIIYADPPWNFHTFSEKGQAKTPHRHYVCMNEQDILDLPVKDISAKDAVLFLWVLDSHLEFAFDVIREWGFTYKTVAFVWAKTTAKGLWHFGQGYWTRGNPEICLLATRGRPKKISWSVRKLVVDERREHSRKPDRIRQDIVNLMGDKKRIELFAREPIAGWDNFGLETDKFSDENNSLSDADFACLLSGKERYLVEWDGIPRDETELMELLKEMNEMTEEMKHVKERSPEEVAKWLEAEQTKFTLGQIHTLTRVASMVDIQPSKYKTTSIFHLRGALRLMFEDGDDRCHALLTMASPEEALQRLKDEAAEQLAKKGLQLDNRSLNTVYSSGDYKDASTPNPSPVSGPRRSSAAAADAVDRHREKAKDGVKFSTKATHSGFKLYALKPGVREQGKEGYAGMQAIVNAQGISFDEWAKGDYGVNHLNWDINRGCVKTVPLDEEFSLG